MISDFLRISPKIACLPIIHGSGDYAIEVRRRMLADNFDCLAVPLPPSFQHDVERAVELLPSISAVLQDESRFVADDAPATDNPDDDENGPSCSYVPIDPCQGVIAALRIALQEQIPRAFIDRETTQFEPLTAVLPDPYALKQVSLETFSAAMLPAIGPPRREQHQQRCLTMAARLRELESRHSSILFICSLMDWPWIREAYRERVSLEGDEDFVEPTRLVSVHAATLAFFLGELPFVTAEYERARANLDDDENLSIDGVKSLVLAARDRYRRDLKSMARAITPKLLSVYFQYVRNLALVERRMTPDLYSLVVAAQQVFGDQFALHVAETAREYLDAGPAPFPRMQMGVEQARLPDGEVVAMKNRLPGHSVVWRRCELRPRPLRPEQLKWQMQWNPYSQCSWPPEDVAIERFRTHVKDAALALLGNDLARTEKFSASLKDGLDLRETLRNWHTGELYVKIFPPVRGNLDCVIMLFDAPADPRDYPWRITWHAEHHDESTLSFFATDFMKETVGPGIALATYGGAMFLFPPRPIRDIWRDKRFDFTDTLEERLIAAGCFYSRERHVALLSAAPPGPGIRRLARKYRRKLVHIPMSRFSQGTIQQLRMFHVLNGRQIRSFAAHFIRRA
ncbi:MAG TPA: hypothetical protein VFG04_16830 [Planctomycetaceae bacterium]|jgi:hypothetical protein|nr:hypothetical protein [Planctomycetaceae bacterium]